ncbi:MAG TPA: ABC transporter ATP-binding protein [Thermoanaerobaculia bacterium]|jgi:oligopeptide/dipeptide ABC transporter ATP-binding protein
MASEPLVAVRDLTVRYAAGDGGAPVTAVDGLSLAIAPGEALGVLGESGCGKTSLALAILGLLPPGGVIAGGSIRFRGVELVGLGQRRLRRLRGAEVSLVFQEPALALHPTRRVGEQVVEVIRAHRRWRARRCRAAAEELLAEVGLAGLGHAYPHQLSGGQRQRVVIAQALSCRPSLVIADEPTAALDATTERQVLDLLNGLRERFGVAFLYISHDPRVLAEIADRLLVMYAGRAAEEGPREDVLREPLHPYAEGLLACMTPAGPGRELRALPGRAPVVRVPAPGCRFAPRCPYRMERCEVRDPVATAPRQGRRVHCFRY